MRGRLPLRDQRGFTLIELLIVILVIAILATIALPMFLGKKEMAHDADAKSNARNLMTYMESCFVPNEDFTKCTTKADTDAADIDWGSGPGQAEVTDTTKSTYTVVAVSKSGHTFTIKRGVSGLFDRTCDTGGSTNEGGCKNGSW